MTWLYFVRTLVPVAKLRSPDGNVHTYFRTSDIDARKRA